VKFYFSKRLKNFVGWILNPPSFLSPVHPPTMISAAELAPPHQSVQFMPEKCRPRDRIE
jgi:hypothetical protein